MSGSRSATAIFAKAVLWSGINSVKAAMHTAGRFLRREPFWAAATGLVTGVFLLLLVAKAEAILQPLGRFGAWIGSTANGASADGSPRCP